MDKRFLAFFKIKTMFLARPVCVLIAAFFFFTSATGQKLEITGQKSLSTTQGQPITLSLSDFSIKGAGSDQYPEGFRLRIYDGKKYEHSDLTVIPDSDFIGNLKVTIRISRIEDGKVKAETSRTDINIQVLAAPAGNVPPRITGQSVLRINANESITISLDHLIVTDPDNAYPTDFTLKLSNGNNYTLTGTTVKPVLNFTGELRVKTVVNDGTDDSPSFDLIISVLPENEDPGNGDLPPEITNFFSDALQYPLGHEDFYISQEIEIDDRDSDELFYAEVFFEPSHFISGRDDLEVFEHPNVKSVFDAKTGLLLLFGKASLSQYQDILKTVRYQYLNDSLPSRRSKQIHFRLNDGAHFSAIKTKTILLNERVSLDIPTVFTPNDDMANDYWVIRPRKEADNLSGFIRVFDTRGRILFETKEIDHHWDGRFQGEPVPSGPYFYVIELKDGVNTTNHKGVVMVLR